MWERSGGLEGTMKHFGGRLLAVAAIAVLLGVAASGGAQTSPRLPVLPLSVTVAEVDGQPVVTDAWLDEQVEHANTIFGAYGVTFRVVARHRMDDSHARLETRADRHALGALLHPQVADCFFVLSLRDVDDPTQMRRGVHWRPPGRPGAHFVIVSSISGPNILAHELGHYFGNTHSQVPGNIMSYERGDGPPQFDDEQGARIQATARHFLARRDLVSADRYEHRSDSAPSRE
jgi:hypothetical protein